MARSAAAAGLVLELLGQLGLQQYIARFLQAEINTWEALAGLSEDDLASLDVRLGHRRKLQREIARRKKYPDYKPLPLPSHLPQSLPTPPTSVLGSIRESVEVNFYSLANKTHSISQWSQETNQAYGASNGTRTLSDGHGMRLRVIDLLQAGYADFHQIGPESPLHDNHQEHVLRILQDLEDSGIQVQWTTNPHANGLGSKEQWLHEVCRTISCKHDLASCHQTHPDPEVDSSGVNVVEVYFEQFLKKLNHFLFLFSESELRQSFDPTDHTPDEDFPIHIYLVLALGAKYSGFQAENLCNEWYMKARLRLLHDDLQDDLEMMRLLTLLCIFKVNDNIDAANHFLNLALDIGLDRGFDADDLPLRDMEDPNRSLWLRVWETIRFLRVWFLLQSRESLRPLPGPSRFIEIEQPPLYSEESYNSRLVQMSMTAVSSILKEVIKDRPNPSTHSPVLYKAHLGALDNWHSNLPLYLCLRPPDSANAHVVYSGGNDRQKTAILNVQSLFLGTLCELLLPALIAVLKSPDAPGSKELDLYAHRCVQAARNIIELCSEMADSGHPISSTWIAQHFLFKVAVIMVLDSMRTSSSLELSQKRLTYIRTAERLLNSGSVGIEEAIIDAKGSLDRT